MRCYKALREKSHVYSSIPAPFRPVHVHAATSDRIFVIFSVFENNCASFSYALPKCAISYGDGPGGGGGPSDCQEGGWMVYGDIYVCKGLHAY